jgi:hypothetical protein
MLFGAIAFCSTPLYATLHTTFAGRPFSEKVVNTLVVNALKLAVSMAFPETEKVVFGSIEFETVRLSVYDQPPNMKLAGATASAL